MGGGFRRTTRRVCLTLAAGCLVAAAIAPSAGAADDDNLPPPEVFSGSAAARGVSVNIHPPDLLPINDLFKFTALDGASTFESSHKAATASLIFPGQGALQGPSLLCGTLLAPSVPPEFKPLLDLCLKYNYPLTVNADEFVPDASTTGSLALGDGKGDLSGDFILARVHAGDDGARSDAVINDLGLLGLPPFGALQVPLKALQLDGSVLKIDSASARTDHRIVKGGLVSKATSTLSGIKLLGGLIDIGSILSESTITDDANGKQTADANLRVTGVTVAGMPAQITNKGLKLGSSSNTSPSNLALMDQVNRLIAASGIKITLLPTDETANKGGPASASTGGLLIEFARDVTGLPLLPSPIGAGQQLDINGKYSITIELGASGAKGQATNFGADGEELGGDTDASGSDLGSDFGSGFDDGSSLGGDDLSGGLAGPTIRNPNNSKSPSLVANTANDFGGRIGFLYLALMFGVLALCIAPRLAIPARFPGPKR